VLLTSPWMNSYFLISYYLTESRVILLDVTDTVKLGVLLVTFIARERADWFSQPMEMDRPCYDTSRQR
jgi:hypothetical protein